MLQKKTLDNYKISAIKEKLHLTWQKLRFTVGQLEFMTLIRTLLLVENAKSKETV